MLEFGRIKFEDLPPEKIEKVVGINVARTTSNFELEFGHFAFDFDLLFWRDVGLWLLRGIAGRLNVESAQVRQAG